MEDNDSAEVGLADAIGQVRAELVRAVDAGRDSPIIFRAGPVELEFEVSFETTVGADAGVRVWVISAGTKGEVTRTAGHRVKITLVPVDSAGNDLLIDSVGTH